MLINRGKAEKATDRYNWQQNHPVTSSNASHLDAIFQLQRSKNAQVTYICLSSYTDPKRNLLIVWRDLPSRQNDGDWNNESYTQRSRIHNTDNKGFLRAPQTTAPGSNIPSPCLPLSSCRLINLILLRWWLAMHWPHCYMKASTEALYLSSSPMPELHKSGG